VSSQSRAKTALGCIIGLFLMLFYVVLVLGGVWLVIAAVKWMLRHW
jgi:cytoskeletal protein RodZ